MNTTSDRLTFALVHALSILLDIKPVIEVSCKFK